MQRHYIKHLGAFVTLLVATLLWGCEGINDDSSGDGIDDGKADTFYDQEAPIASLQMLDYTAVDGEQESFALLAEAGEPIYDQVVDGDSLQVEIWASDGASNPDYRIDASVTFYEEGVGAFMSETIDTSTLLPWLRLSIRIHGLLSSGYAIDQTFTFEPGETEGAHYRPGQDRMIEALGMLNHQVIDGESETFELIAEAGEPIYDEVVDGDLLTAEIWASDGASNPDFRLSATLTFYADGVGAFMSETIDTSELLPWLELTVRLSGTLTSGTVVDESFVFVPGEVSARPVEEDEPEPMVHHLENVSMHDYQSADGELESFALIAEAGASIYDEVVDGDVLDVEVWASDGASNPEYRLAGRATFSADGLGAFMTETIDTSTLLPWLQLSVRFSGELSSGTTIDEVFIFEAGDTVAEPYVEEPEPAVHHLENVTMHDYQSAEGELESFALIAEVGASIYDEVVDGDILVVEVWASDGASNPDYRLNGTATFYADGLGAFMTETIDTSTLLPWQQLSVRFSGELSSGTAIDETFAFDTVEGSATPL